MVNWLHNCAALNSNRNNRLNVNGNNHGNNDNSYAFGMALASKTPSMETENIYPRIYSFNNLLLAYQKARKRKTKKPYVIKFEKNMEQNLCDLQFELQTQTYKPKTLQTFILRDPKTRVISKSDFRDRVIHHAIVNILEPIFEKCFIYDSCANRKGKGTLFALQRFEKFRRKVTNNFTSEAFCLKADVKHYFQEVNHEILLQSIKRKIQCKKTLWLIQQIIKANFSLQRERERVTLASEASKGMPLGNLTSQFFANVYLNELDYFVKHQLNAKYYIRYVDDFVLLYNSMEQLIKWKLKANNFLRKKLKLELHKDKSRIVSLSQGVDFVGFRNFYYFKSLRKRSIRKMQKKISCFHKGNSNYGELTTIFQGFNAHAKWANAYQIRRRIASQIYKIKHKTLKTT